MCGPTFVDLFAGAGLFSHAFVKTGFTPSLAVELDESAAQSYAINVGDHIVCGDVRRVSPPYSADVVLAGPPCQGFSTLNRNRADDPRNKCSFDIIRWIKALDPKLVVVENVAPFYGSDVYNSLVRRLERRDYAVTSGVVNAIDYGVPQNRRRTVLIASRIGTPNLPCPTVRRHRTVRDAWKGLSLKPDGERMHFAPTPSKLAMDRFRAISPGGDRRSIMRKRPDLSPSSWWRIAENDNTGVWGRMVYDEPAPTIRTQFQNPSKGRYIHPSQNRVITLREGARLQSIPDRWRFFGHRTYITRQIGNGVPIRLGKAIAKVCLALLVG